MSEADLDLEGWRTLLGAQFPRYAPSPTPGARHELALAEKAARLLGHTLLPWQRYFFRVFTELNDDGTYRYQQGLLTVPRQSGKTFVMQVLMTLRALKRPHERIYHTAQTGKDAREHSLVLQDLLLRKLPPAKLRIARSAADTRTSFPNGSKITPFPPKAEGLHGYTGSTILLDEIFAHSMEDGSLLMGAVVPVQQTLPHKQLLMLSTMGTTQSEFLNSLIEKGRSGTPSLAYFEWSADESADYYDPASWDFHPALGHTITAADIQRAADTLTRGEFVRSTMNRLTVQTDSLFDAAQWDRCRGTLSTPTRSRVAVAFQASRDQDRAAVVAAWRDDDGTTNLKVLKNGYGTDWLSDYMVRVHAGRPLATGTDGVAHNVQFLPEMERKKRTLTPTTFTPAQIKTASVQFKTALSQGRIRHDGHSSLRNAVLTAQSRPMGEGWSISHASQPEAIAAVVAMRLLDEVRPSSKPISYTS